MLKIAPHGQSGKRYDHDAEAASDYPIAQTGLQTRFFHAQL